jgi:hypothetical protein
MGPCARSTGPKASQATNREPNGPASHKVGCVAMNFTMAPDSFFASPASFMGCERAATMPSGCVMTSSVVFARKWVCWRP